MGSIYSDRGIVSSRFLLRVFRSCLHLGARQPVLLEAMQLQDADLRNPLNRFDATVISVLCQAAARELDCHDIHARIGQGLVPTGFSDTGYAGMFENTLGKSLFAILEAQGLGSCGKPYHLDQSNRRYRFTWDRSCPRSEDLVQLAFWALVHSSQSLAEGGFRAIKAIHFSHAKPARCNDSVVLPGRSQPLLCYYDQLQSFLEMSSNIMSLPNSKKNPLVVRARRRQRESFMGSGKQPRLMAELSYNYLVYLLDKTGLSLEAAAETFDMAERTFRRKLVAEGTSFRRILEQVRRDTCQLYFLEGNRLLSEIAPKLGYSELSAFTRAYTAWYGHPPSQDLGMPVSLAA